MELCEIYEGNIRAYQKLESTAKELSAQLRDRVVDKSQKIEQFVVDFIQDSSNKWYLLKIKYGKTCEKQRPTTSNLIRQHAPLESPTRRIQPKLNCSGDYCRVSHSELNNVLDYEESADINNYLNNSRITALLKNEPVYKGYYKIARKKIIEHRVNPRSKLSQISPDFRSNSTFTTDVSFSRLYDRLPVCGFCYKIYSNDARCKKLAYKQRKKDKMSKTFATLPVDGKNMPELDLSMDSLETRQQTAAMLTTAASYSRVGTRSTKLRKRRIHRRRIIKK